MNVIEILGWYTVRSVLPDGKMSLKLWLVIILVMVSQKNTLWDKCLTTSTSLFYWVCYNWSWIIRSVETDLRGWKLLQVVININVIFFCFLQTWTVTCHLLFVFTDLTCHLESTGIVWILPHQLFTNHHSCSWYVLIRSVFSLFKIIIIITNIFHWFASLSSQPIKLLII